MPESENTNEPDPPTHDDDRSPKAAVQTALDRIRLRLSEAAVADQVVEFQFARHRIGFAPDPPVEGLSPREREVLHLVAQGRSDGEIADRLFISKKTASVHVANIKGKLGASTRVEIALLAVRHGLVDADEASAEIGAVGRSPARGPVVCPFKGLASFDVADAPFFFGRERLVAELVARLAGSTFLSVVGPSGSGKSSVVRAGLVPALAEGVLPGSRDWTTVIVRPGARPTDTLRRGLIAALRGSDALRRSEADAQADSSMESLDALPPGGRLLLVVDQFEETFTSNVSEADREAFVGVLVRLARDPGFRALVVVVVRADFYGRCAAYGDLADLLERDQVLVGPMTADELARAVDLPARSAGLRVEPELARSLASDVLDEPGGLPLLSTTLLDLWQRRDGRTLRLAAYEEVGGVSGAVSRLAEAAFGRLTTEQGAIARSIFLRLAGPDDGDSIVSRQAPTREFDGDRNGEVRRVLDVLTDGRLVTVSVESVEVAHEALFREWPRLRSWLEEDAAGRRVRDHLSRAAADWESAGEDPAELYRGARLATALEWSAGHELELNDLERRFLGQSQIAVQRDIDAERRTNRRLRTLLTGVLASLVLAVGAGGFAASQLGRAEEQAARAQVQATRAEAEATRAREAEEFARSRELAASAVAVMEEDPGLSKMLAVAASSLSDLSLESVSALHRAMAADPMVFRYSWSGDGVPGPLVTDLDPSGRLIVATGGYGRPDHDRLEVVDRVTNESLWSFEAGHEGVAVGLGLFSPDGDRVIAGTYRDPFDRSGAMPPSSTLGVHVWDSRTGEPARSRIDVGSCGGIVSAVSETHVLVRTKASPTCFVPPPEPGQILELVDLRSGARRTLSSSLVGEGEALSADGRYVAFDDDSDPEPVSVVLDQVTGKRVLEIPRTVPHGVVRDLSADGSLLLYGDDPLRVWDVGRGVRTHISISGLHHGARFEPSGLTFFTTGLDASLRQWDATTGDELAVVADVGTTDLSATAGGLVVVADWATSTASLVSTKIGGELAVIEARAQGEYWNGIEGHADCLVSDQSLQAAGRLTAFADLCAGRDAEHSTQVLDVERGELLYSLPGGGGTGLAFSPDGTRFVRQEASGHRYGPIKIWDTLSGQEVLELEGLCTYENVGPSPEDRGECRAFPNEPFPIWAYRLRWSPDGRMVAAVPAPASGWGGFVAVWNADDGSRLPTARTDGGPYVHDAIFSPDSRHLLASYFGGAIQTISTTDWRVVDTDQTVRVSGNHGLAFLGFSPDGSVLHALSGLESGGGGTLHWLDAETLGLVRAGPDPVHIGAPVSMAVSPAGASIAIGASDGTIRVWDAATGLLEHEISIDTSSVQGVAFVNERHLAIVRNDGDLKVVTIDRGELLDLVRRSLTRGFTAAECERFSFIDACPSLADLRGD